MPKYCRLGALLVCSQLAFGVQANAAPIHDAALDGDLEQLKQLLDEGADVNSPDDAGTPLQWALFVGQVEVVRLLLERGADPNIGSSSGTPLQTAVVSGNTEIVGLLLAHGAEPNQGDRSTPLTAAAQKGSIEMIEMLLAQGADPGFATYEGITALHEAAKAGHLEIAQRLVAQGADVNAITAAGRPPIHLAVLGKHAALADYLREQGAAPGEVAPIADLLPSANLAEGEQEAKTSCSGCHKFEDGKNTYGPHLWNVVGRPKGSIGEFAYSPAFSALEGVWTFEDLNAFLACPADFIPGTKMELVGISETQKRATLIAYLRTLSDAPVPLP